MPPVETNLGEAPAFAADFCPTRFEAEPGRKNAVVLPVVHIGGEEDELHLVGARLVEDRRDHPVHADALPGPRHDGDEEVGHSREVGDDGVPLDVDAEGDRQERGGPLELLALDHLARVGHERGPGAAAKQLRPPIGLSSADRAFRGEPTGYQAIEHLEVGGQHIAGADDPDPNRAGDRGQSVSAPRSR